MEFLEFNDINYILLFKIVQEFTGQNINEVGQKMGYTPVYCSMVLKRAYRMTNKFKKSLTNYFDSLYGDGASKSILLHLDTIIDVQNNRG